MNMQMICKGIFSIHTQGDAKLRLKFTQLMKLEALYVVPEKKRVRWKYRSCKYGVAQVEVIGLKVAGFIQFIFFCVIVVALKDLSFSFGFTNDLEIFLKQI